MGYTIQIQIRDSSRVTFRYFKLNVQLHAIIRLCYIDGHCIGSTIRQVDNVHVIKAITSVTYCIKVSFASV